MEARASSFERRNVPRFRFEHLAVLSSLNPRGGPLVGGTLITLHGRGFGRESSNFTCRFENGTDLSQTIDALSLIHI